ncbi:MAG: hypothetical protein IPG75_20810 [Gemmatimonadetes bacterium]|nr:hypothetical protein [Gemmatimonadota bacterium]
MLAELTTLQTSLAQSVSEQAGFQTRAQEVDGLRSRLVHALDSVRLLRQRQIAVITSPRTARTLEVALAVFERARQDRSFLIDGQALTRLKGSVDGCVEDLQTRVRDAWREYCQQRIPPIDNAVLAPLAGIPALSGGIAALRDGISRLKNLMESGVSESVVVAFDATVAEVQSAWDGFDDGNIESSVLAFIKDAAARGAALDSLTPEVLAWLRRHNIVNSFRIRVGPSNLS